MQQVSIEMTRPCSYGSLLDLGSKDGSLTNKTKFAKVYRLKFLKIESLSFTNNKNKFK